MQQQLSSVLEMLVFIYRGASAACQSQAKRRYDGCGKKKAIMHSPHSPLHTQKHKHRQVDLDFLCAINPEGLLPHSLVFTQMPNGAYNAAQRNGLSFFPS